MSKLKRDPRSFAARVKMGQAELWLLVEGRVHDQPFYDRLLRAQPGLHNFSIRLAESLELDGKSAGGKDFALKLFGYFESRELLRQESGTGTRYVAFALDRDLDHISGVAVSSPHVIYTHTMDVESEILLNGDLLEAACLAFSLTQETVRQILPDAHQAALQLAETWKEWILLGSSAICCGISNDVHFSHRSKINSNGYGAVNQDKANEFHAKLVEQAELCGKRKVFDAVRTELEGYFNRSDEWHLVKGKWIAGYVWKLVADALRDEPRDRKVATETLSKTCLALIDFSAPWSRPYRKSFEQLLRS